MNSQNIWEEVNEAHKPKITLPTNKHGGESIISKNKAGNRNRGKPEGSFFNSYYTKV